MSLFSFVTKHLKYSTDPWVNTAVLTINAGDYLKDKESAAQADKELVSLQMQLPIDMGWRFDGIEMYTKKNDDNPSSRVIMISLSRLEPNKYPYELTDEKAYELFKKRIGIHVEDCV